MTLNSTDLTSQFNTIAKKFNAATERINKARVDLQAAEHDSYHAIEELIQLCQLSITAVHELMQVVTSQQIEIERIGLLHKLN